MPVLIVFMVNLGIFISGLMVLKYVFKINLLILTIISIITICFLILLYLKSKKMNTIAVLIGAVGYILLYISLITLSINNNTIISIIFYGIAIVLFIMLCGIGIKANLKNPKIHWIIEISNVICQMLVAIATLIVFK